MNAVEHWGAISSRIHGLVQAGVLCGQLLAARSRYAYGSLERLREQSESILLALREYRRRFEQELSQRVLDAIGRFIERNDALITDTTGSRDSRDERAKAAIVSLAAFETELSFLLSNPQQSIRRRSERAFAHLQRSIVADSSVRDRWSRAYTKGEVACEILGAVHLLLHGIWAFKVNAAGERTDLVYPEPLSESEVQRGASGLVLTEWKRAKGRGEAGKRFEEARSQARRYALGSLGGLELANYRYAVVVTGEHVDPPEDVTENGVVYRHVCIAVRPAPPSRRSRDRA